MQLKDVLCQIDPDGFPWMPASPLRGSNTTNLAHCDAVGEGWHPPHLETISQMSDDPLISLPAVAR
ncbi:hypothetical protein NKI48_29505 [Mesorhizobium sp. M0644]|uniref:hypothetical protein n=1 Tax=Mesorhizobium sp. M0644 TaxID=2956979 RepID=UPI00333A16B6